jgi:hypothetical protein
MFRCLARYTGVSILNKNGGLLVKKVFLLLFGFLILVGSLLACGNDTANSGSTTTPAATSPTAKHSRVGETVKVGNLWEVVVNSVKTSKGDDYTKPDAGRVFLVITVSLKNISATEQNVSSLLSFKLRDSTGTEGKTSFLTSGVDPAPNGKVAAGSPVKGDLVYEVADSQKQFTLAFEADLTSGGQTIWDLSI